MLKKIIFTFILLIFLILLFKSNVFAVSSVVCNVPDSFYYGKTFYIPDIPEDILGQPCMIFHANGYLFLAIANSEYSSDYVFFSPNGTYYFNYGDINNMSNTAYFPVYSYKTKDIESFLDSDYVKSRLFLCLL